jgi:hypothetical protein
MMLVVLVFVVKFLIKAGGGRIMMFVVVLVFVVLLKAEWSRMSVVLVFVV